MTRARHVAVWSGAGLVVAAIGLVSCSTVSRTVLVPPLIEGATFVGDQACADCHVPINRLFPASPHGRLHLAGLKLSGSTGCESCHGPGSRHVAVGGGRGRFIVNPGKDPAACLNCHLDVQAEFHLPQHHPVPEGKMSCAHCHDPHGSDIMKPAGGLAMARLNEQCAQCHREQARPMVFEHEALREGCLVCHHPHGSVNARLLVEPDNNLCLKCHAQVQGGAAAGAPAQFFIGARDHALFIARGTCWASGCHTAVHGSNVNPKMRY
jgi:predicted CXXCH cytochrome family protein